MCAFCNGEFLLSGEIETIDDIILFGKEADDVVKAQTIIDWTETTEIDVQIDRGNLVLWVGEDRGCLDHADSRIEINYCPMCGAKIE